MSINMVLGLSDTQRVECFKPSAYKPEKRTSLAEKRTSAGCLYAAILLSADAGAD